MRRTTLNSAQVQRGIGIVAASTAIDKKLLLEGLHHYAHWGIPALIDDRVYHVHESFAGTDQTRAKLILSLLKNPHIGTLWCARGGYGATRILGILDKLNAAKAMRKDPKLLLGFSDATALHFYFYQKCGIASVHAPMPASNNWKKMSAATSRSLREILNGNMPVGKKSHSALWNTKNIGPRKNAEGILLGGNLTLLMNLIGTPWQPDLKGKILFLEDCAEPPYRVDRMLQHLENAGMLKGLRGVVLGDFEADVVYRHANEKKLWKGVFGRFADLGIPTISNLPVGHSVKNEPLPLGVKAAIQNGKLLILEQPVKS